MSTGTDLSKFSCTVFQKTVTVKPSDIEPCGLARDIPSYFIRRPFLFYKTSLKGALAIWDWLQFSRDKNIMLFPLLYWHSSVPSRKRFIYLFILLIVFVSRKSYLSHYDSYGVRYKSIYSSYQTRMYMEQCIASTFLLENSLHAKKNCSRTFAETLVELKVHLTGLSKKYLPRPSHYHQVPLFPEQVGLLKILSLHSNYSSANDERSCPESFMPYSYLQRKLQVAYFKATRIVF